MTSPARDQDVPSTSIAILGAGLSGVLMGMQLRRAGIDDFVIIEKQPDVGGTWYRNTYPGLHCDVPSHLYCYSFEPNPDWSTRFASQREIQAYIRYCAEKYDLLCKTRFATCVETARFDGSEGRWDLDTADGGRSSHRALVSATGGLTEPHIPAFPGLHEFEGPSWHSGAWRDDVVLRGKRVAVVGSAASAIQVVPEVARGAAEVHVFQRTPNWVMPRHNTAYTAQDRDRLQNPEHMCRHRRDLYRQSLTLHRVFRRRPNAVRMLRNAGLGHMQSAISDPAVLAALTPRYEPGCKRILVSDDYYPTLALDHVTLHPQGVQALTRSGVVAADGSEQAVDAVIFCTGYKLGGRVDGRPALEVFGRRGQRLLEALAERPETYRGVSMPGFPNYFTLCGINGVAAYTSLFASAEVQSEWIVDRLRDLHSGRYRTLEVDGGVCRRYNEVIQAELQTMSWAEDCPSFYRDASGRILSFYPGTLGRMRQELRAAGDSECVVE